MTEVFEPFPNIPDIVILMITFPVHLEKFKRWQDSENITVVDTEAELSNFAGRSTEAEIEKQMLFQ